MPWAHHRQDIQTYKDESDYFYDDPYDFLVKRFDSPHPTHAWPSHLALFEALLPVQGAAADSPTVASLLADRGYRVERRYWNSLYHLDSRRRGQVLLMERST